MAGGFSALLVSQLATPQAQQQQQTRPTLAPLVVPQQSRKSTRAQQLQQQSLHRSAPSSPSGSKQQGQQQQQQPTQQQQQQSQPQTPEPAPEHSDVSPVRSRCSSPAPGTPTGNAHGELRTSGGKKLLWEAAGALCSPTFRGRMAPGIMAATGVHQIRRAQPHSNNRNNKELLMAEDAVDTALDLYRSRMLPNLSSEPAFFAAMHPDALRAACHDYMDNVVHVGNVDIVTDKYRELKGLCEEEYEVLSQRVAAEARAAAARAQRQGVASLASKFVQQRRASMPGGLMVDIGRRPMAADSEGGPPSPWSNMRSSLEAVTEDARGGAAGPTSSSATSSPTKHPHSHLMPQAARSAPPPAAVDPASPGSNQDLKLPAINRSQLNTGTVKFIDEAPPSLSSNQSVVTQLAFTGIRSCDANAGAAPKPHSGSHRDRSISDYGLSHAPTLSPTPSTSSPGQRLPSALLSALYPTASGPSASVRGVDWDQDGASLPAGMSDKMGALVSSWDRAGPKGAAQKVGVMAAYHTPHDTVVRLHHSQESAGL